jgi:predicted peptidase
MRSQYASWTFFTLTAFVLGGPLLAASVNDFIVYSLLDSNNQVLLPGRLHIPADYATNPDQDRPLILFLHGGGESGTNNLSQINGNIDNLLTGAKNRGAFLYAPQTNCGWGDCPSISRAMTMIDRAISDYGVDPNRIYVTGLSLGGGGVWNVLNQFPDRVAAAVPICGGGPPPDFMPAEHLDIPIWAFHGRFDNVVHVSNTRNIIDSFLVAAGQTPPTYLPPNTFPPHQHFNFSPLNLRYTDMRGNHGIWPEVYNNFTIEGENLYDWMFAHTQIPEPGTLPLAFVALLALFCRDGRSRPFPAQR